jgi:hypothetical protein
MIRHMAQRMMDMNAESLYAAACGKRSPERARARSPAANSRTAGAVSATPRDAAIAIDLIVNSRRCLDHLVLLSCRHIYERHDVHFVIRIFIEGARADYTFWKQNSGAELK